jgi:hypothetical protein
LLQTFFGNVGFGKTALKVPYEKKLNKPDISTKLKNVKKIRPRLCKKNLEKLALNVDKSSVCATEIPLSFFFHGFVDSLLYTRLETLLKIVRYTMSVFFKVFVQFCIEF